MTAPAPGSWVLRTIRQPSAALLRDISRLFHSVGMRRRRPAEMARAIRFSDLSIAAFYGGRLFGFGRLVSDRSYYGTLWDVAVERSYQGRGLGSAIVERLLERASKRGLVMVGLFTSSNNDSFYQRLRFRKLKDIHPMTSSPLAFKKLKT